MARLSKYTVMVECREKKRHAKMEHVKVEVVAVHGGYAERKAVRKMEGKGMVVGRVYDAVRQGPATVADELRDAGVPSLFEVVSDDAG